MAKLKVGENDLQTVNPELAAEWHPTKNGDLKPCDVMPGSGRKVWWQCSKGHEWMTSPNNRSKSKGTGCPYCSGNIPIKGVNDLQTVNPDLAAEWHPTKNGNLLPNMVFSNSGKKVWWKCAHGHEWAAVIYNRNKGIGCPYCSGQRLINGVNDLQTVYPELALEWNYKRNGSLKPSSVFSQSNIKVWWKCSKGHEWETLISSRASGYGCPYCSGRRVIKGETDLATVNPNLASEWNYKKNGRLLPDMVLPISAKKVWWKCRLGHEWIARIADRSYGTGCPICNESHLEKYTRRYLDRYHYDYREQVKFVGFTGVGDSMLSYDFGLYENDELYALVECQGLQHYRPADFFGGDDQYEIQCLHDELKQEFCEVNHILLITIPYDFTEEEIEEMFQR